MGVESFPEALIDGKQNRFGFGQDFMVPEA